MGVSAIVLTTSFVLLMVAHADINLVTVFSLQSFEIMGLVKQDVFDFAFGLPRYVNPAKCYFQ